MLWIRLNCYYFITHIANINNLDIFKFSKNEMSPVKNKQKFFRVLLPVLISLAGLFYYFYCFFGPGLYYHLYQPVFLFDQTFFQEFFAYPGGMADWLTAFFVQFFIYKFWGAVILAVVFTAIFGSILHVLHRSNNGNCLVLPAFLPLGFLLVLFNQYNFPLVIAVKYLIALVLFSGYIRAVRYTRIVYIAGVPLIYWILGGWVFLFYILLCLLYDLLFFRTAAAKTAAGFHALFLLLPYIVARFFYIMTFKEAYFYVCPNVTYFEPVLFGQGVLFYLFFLSLPALLLLIFTLKWAEISDRCFGFLRHKVFQSTAVMVLAVVLFKVSFNQEQKYKISIDYCAERGLWREVLDLAFEFKGYDQLVNFHVNRALFHTGQLLDNLFSYPQKVGTDGLFINRFIAGQIAIPASDLYFELGHINAAQAWAYEAQAKYKYNPRILKRLLLLNLVNENYVAAEKFVKLLKKSPIHRRWALKYEKYISDPSLTEKDRLLVLKRRQSPKTDFFISHRFPCADLRQLLEDGPINKMAFEYLAAYSLLDCSVRDILRNIKHLNNFGYDTVPRHVQEAMIMIKAISKSSARNMGADLKNMGVGPDVMNDFKNFTQFVIRHKKSAKARMDKKFQDTYWYYVRYVNPRVTNVNVQGVKVRDKVF